MREICIDLVDFALAHRIQEHKRVQVDYFNHVSFSLCPLCNEIIYVH